ncbi:hypothetical protein PVAND_007618 [Polypedilum vanderplanki]|uniref:F-box domain-containing protein n=1 Tax=Polypedilum vanderplanki TaxID=319348 RepID=A0A9J6C8D1_POLVA|nr:hypothetical protein PVAND_007618 [Polypedilum vanderplanki]
MNNEIESKANEESKKDAGMVEKFINEEKKYQNEIITLDLATYHEIPRQLHHIITCINKSSKFDVFNMFVMYAMYEIGFIGDWIEQHLLSHLSLNWCYSFDQRVFEFCTLPQQLKERNDYQLKLTFKFALDPERQVVLYSHLSGDLVLLTVYEQESHNNLQLGLNSKSLTVPISRYIPFNRLSQNIPNSFRNLKELSIKLKDNLLLSLRNDIYNDNQSSAMPYINGLPSWIVIKIFKYLKKKDVYNLKCSCRKMNDVYKAFIHN